MANAPGPHKLPNGQASEHSVALTDVSRLQARIDELERLCGELYEMGVALGVPRHFLNKLWTVAARGNAPQSFDIPLEAAHAGGGAAAEPAEVAHDSGVVDVRLIHTPMVVGKSATVPLRPLDPLPQRCRVMVVDDDPAILAFVLRVLATENYELVVASSGREALDMLTAPIDLLITDYVMPGMDGRQLAEEVWKRYPYVKVLYETGFTDLLFKEQRETERNAAFIEKPYSARGLIEAARLALFGYIQPPPAKHGA